MLRILCFGALGLLVGGIVLTAGTGDPDFIWMWTTALPVAILSGVFLILGRAFRSVQTPSEEDTARALAEGRAALARVTHVRPTGTSLNNVPVCEIGLIVAPRDRPAYRTEVRKLLDPVGMYQFRAGQIKVVGRHAFDRPEVWLVDAPDTTWARAAEEGEASVPVDAPEWKTDRGAPGVGRQPFVGIGASGRPVRLAVFGLAFLLGAGIPVALNWNQLVSPSGAFGDADYVRTAVEELIAVMGDSQVTDITFHDDFVTAEAPSSPGALTIDDYEYRYGEAEHEGPSLIQPEDPAAELFDLNDVDFSAFPAIAAAAMKATGIDDADSPLIVVSRGYADGGRGPIEISVSLYDEYYDGNYTTDAQGNLLTMSGGLPGSDAYKAEHADD